MPCVICESSTRTLLACYAAPDCPPRGLKFLCRGCANAADAHPVANYEFFSAPLNQAAQVLDDFEWLPEGRRQRLQMLN